MTLEFTPSSRTRGWRGAGFIVRCVFDEIDAGGDGSPNKIYDLAKAVIRRGCFAPNNQAIWAETSGAFLAQPGCEAAAKQHNQRGRYHA